jgi:hypothetical protein
MRQPRQRIVDALRREGGQRARAVLVGEAEPVDDVVMGRLQVRHVERIAQREGHRAFLRHLHLGIVQYGEMHRDRRRGRADIDRNAMVLDQQADLLAQVVAEKVGPGDGGHVGPGFGHVTEGEAESTWP